MLTQPGKTADLSTNDPVTKAAARVTYAAEQLRAGAAEITDATALKVKSEVDNLSRLTRDIAASIGAEVGRRPLTYTLASAGAGALFGLGIVALLNRRRNASH